jgi:putative tryptophan/tyrosine transport system substrate-binding protein
MRFAMKKAAVPSILFAVVLLAVGVTAQAQQPTKVPRIGFLVDGSPSTHSTRIEAFRHGLRELGYVEGKNINIEYRYAEGRSERLPELAEQLVRLKVDVLVGSSSRAARPAKNASATIPIVVALVGDPIGSGLMASLARPGGNVTGLYQYSPELLGKRLELLKEIVPKVSGVAFLYDTDSKAFRSFFKDAQITAQALALKFQVVEVNAQNPDYGGAFRFMVNERIGTLITEATPLATFHRNRILELVEQNRIPAIHSDQEWAEAGGLISYDANRADLFRRAAVYVDKILKGAKPADLPVEQPIKFELVINLKTAKTLGLTIPPTVLHQADRVIK